MQVARHLGSMPYAAAIEVPPHIRVSLYTRGRGR